MTENNTNEVNGRKIHLLDFNKISKMANVITPKPAEYQRVRNIDKETIERWLDSPQVNSNNLILASEYFYNTNNIYKRIVKHFSNMCPFAYVLEPKAFNTELDDKEKEKIKKQYNKLMETISNMNIQHEFKKILSLAFKNDAFFGYEIETKDSYYILPLPIKYCSIHSILDGTYKFLFDFSYFDNRENQYKLETYPKEFQNLYADYKAGKTFNSNYVAKWQELPLEKQICIKINEDVTYLLPPFASLFPAMLDVKDYKALDKAKDEIDNYIIVHQKIPLDEKSDEYNDFKITQDVASSYHSAYASVLPPQFMLITSPMDVSVHKTSMTDNRNLKKSTENLFLEAGISQVVFSDKANGSIGINQSLKSDETITFEAIGQIQRWINTKIKNMPNGNKFEIEILQVSVFGIDKYIDQLLKLGQYGFPVKNRINALIGVKNPSLSGYLENDIIELLDYMQPLKSSHTQSSDDGNDNNGGRPEQDEVDTEGEKTRDNDSNEDRAV